MYKRVKTYRVSEREKIYDMKIYQAKMLISIRVDFDDISQNDVVLTPLKHL